MLVLEKIQNGNNYQELEINDEEIIYSRVVKAPDYSDIKNRGGFKDFFA